MKVKFEIKNKNMFVKKLSQEQIDEVISLAPIMSMKEIAKKMKIGINKTQKIVRESGVKAKYDKHIFSKPNKGRETQYIDSEIFNIDQFVGGEKFYNLFIGA